MREYNFRTVIFILTLFYAFTVNSEIVVDAKFDYKSDTTVISWWPYEIEVTQVPVVNCKMTNSTSVVWQLGGYRIVTENGQIKTNESAQSSTYGIFNYAMTPQFMHEYTVNRNDISGASKFGISAVFAPGYNANSQDIDENTVIVDAYPLLQTGGAGIPDKPVAEDPIDFNELKLIVEDADYYKNVKKLDASNYYDTDYVYKDDLGTNGGRYSGGFLDTWKGKTQIQFPEKSTVKDDGSYFDCGTTRGPMYWMALSGVQEYINVDMQWMAGFGAKETEAGLGGAGHVYKGANEEGAFGPFEVEGTTGADRAITYYMYYPEYPELANAAAVNTISPARAPIVAAQYPGAIPAGGTSWWFDFMRDYMGYEPLGPGSAWPDKNGTPINSAYVVNGAIMAATNMYGMYNALSYNTNFEFKKAIDGSADPLLGLAAIAPLYNLGGGNIDGICAPINQANWQTTHDDPNARDLFPEGNSFYRSAILSYCNLLIDASSKISTKDPTISIYDAPISWTDVESFYFGVGGTPANQGKGGILKHFVMGDLIKRQGIYDTLQLAFNYLKGKAPSTIGTEKISYRYDWLSLMRTVKTHFHNDAFYNKAAGGDLLVYSGSNNKSDPNGDTTYPHSEITGTTYDTDFILDLTTSDIGRAGVPGSVFKVKWSIDSSWGGTWNIANSSGSNSFNIVVPKDKITATFGDNTGTLWYMVEDSSGNTIVRSTTIKGNPLRSAAAIDTKGDGKAHKINVHIADAALESGDDPLSPSSLKYSWPTKASLSNASGINHSTDLLFFTPANDDGDGLGLVELLFPSMDGNTASKDIVDSVGPAVESATYKFGETGSASCTLTVILTEDIEEISDAAIDYLIINGNVIEQEAIKKGSNNSTWIFILNSSVSVNNGDMLKLVHNTGIVDVSPQNNPPLDINNEVPINVIKKSESLELLSATFEDTDANGKMDKITFEINGPAVTSDDLDNITFKVTWLNGSGNIDTIIISGADLDDNMSYKVLDGQSIKEYLTAVNADSSFGKVTFIHKVINSDSWDTTNYSDVAIDEMAPVVVSANYYIYKSSNISDEMNVTFSEDVDNLSGNEPFAFNDGSYKLSLNLQNLAGNVAEFSVNNTNTTPQDGDSVNINYEAGIKDKNGNVQDNQLNKHVKLNIASAIGILNVSYHDFSTPRNGYIDAIKVITDTEISTELFDSLVNKIKLNESRNFKPIKSADFIMVSNSQNKSFFILVSQEKGTDKNTAITNDDLFQITDDVKCASGFIMSSTKDINDSLAPVIVAAYLNPVEITQENQQDQLSDTLRIKYSEPVDFDLMMNNPLNFKNVNGTPILVDLEKSTSIGDSLIIYMVDYNSMKPKNGDSVQIDTSGSVTDIKKNVQIEDNVFVPINVNPVAFHWNIGVYPNPVYKDDENQVKEKKKNLSDYLNLSEDDIKKGTQAIVIDPLGPAPASDAVEISITIYDALGHRIVDDEGLKVSDNGEVWYFLWNGQNVNGRDVGSGIYLAYLRITPEEFGIISEPLKLGIGK